jgi:hypothetical protein
MNLVLIILLAVVGYYIGAIIIALLRQPAKHLSASFWKWVVQSTFSNFQNIQKSKGNH